MHFITRKHLSRRALLRGAGTALALPLLDAMIPAATAQRRTAAAVRPRFAGIYFPHGAIMDKWTPDTLGRSFSFPEILQPMEQFRENLCVVSGFSLPLAYGDDASAGANHTRSSAVFLSGAKPGVGARANLGETMDQVVARHMGQDTPLPSLELTVEDGSLSCGTGLSCAYRNTIAWRTPTSPLPMENNPQVVFERLFGDGATDEERRLRRNQSRSLLDSITEEVGHLKGELPAEDRLRLEQYLENVREVERRIALAAQSIPEGLEVPAAPPGIPDDFEDHIKLMFDLMVLAWQAEITRVSTLMLAKEVSNAVYPNSGVRDPFHNLSHHSNNRDSMERFAQLNRYHVNMFAYLLEKLRDTPDGETSLLENSMVLYGSGMSDGNQHNHHPLPVLLAGAAGGSLQGGRHLQASIPGEETLSNLLLGMLHKLDIPVDSFGDSTGPMEL